MWVDGYGAFVLEIADLEIEAFDLSVEHEGYPIGEADLLFLEGLGFVVIGEDGFRVGFFLRVRLTGTIQLEEFLDACIARSGIRSTVLNDSIFGLDLF